MQTASRAIRRSGRSSTSADSQAKNGCVRAHHGLFGTMSQTPGNKAGTPLARSPTARPQSSEPGGHAGPGVVVDAGDDPRARTRLTPRV
jgi:hypothetical protein